VISLQRSHPRLYLRPQETECGSITCSTARGKLRYSRKVRTLTQRDNCFCIVREGYDGHVQLVGESRVALACFD
jgi:hypothetical protein